MPPGNENDYQSRGVKARRSEQEEHERKNRQSTGKDQTDGTEHWKFNFCSSVLYHRTEQTASR